ncbi:hypothetical protein Rs2_04792 [Raphanus sativus]|nr:hypothetical protein Rs2_04792 [Raphanus sativus]
MDVHETVETKGSQLPLLDLPERIFAARDEPTGVRVTPYHKAYGIRQIINSLDPGEVELVRLSPFGKLVDIADRPMFSGRMLKKKTVVDKDLRLKYAYLALLSSLVMVEAVPSLTEVVHDGSSSGSETERGDEDDSLDVDKSDKRSICPGHGRETDVGGKV